LQVAADGANSVLVAVVGRPDPGVRDAKQHEGVLRSVLSSVQLTTPALLVDGVTNVTWQEVLPHIYTFAETQTQIELTHRQTCCKRDFVLQTNMVISQCHF
jgi:hypothetical protein